MTDWRGIATAICDTAQHDFEIAHSAPVGGGDINVAYQLEGRDGSRYFVKLNDARRLAMFEAEALGLQAIAATQTIRVPRPITHGVSGSQSFLVLEHLEFGLRGRPRELGERLAALHRLTSAQPATAQSAAQEVNSDQSRTGCSATPCHGRTPNRFGFDHDNFIGSTPQPNGWTDDWVEFLRKHRFGYQLDLAEDNGYRLRGPGEELLAALPCFFEDYTPQPSLLHGDLWGGNHAFLADGTPAIFDPAAYYGDREADLAMTELFGGYPAEFYAAYRAAWPLDPGYAMRRELYNLYHILNHANLFGSDYARQAEAMMQRLLATIQALPPGNHL